MKVVQLHGTQNSFTYQGLSLPVHLLRYVPNPARFSFFFSPLACSLIYAFSCTWAKNSFFPFTIHLHFSPAKLPPFTTLWFTSLCTFFFLFIFLYFFALSASYPASYTHARSFIHVTLERSERVQALMKTHRTWLDLSWKNQKFIHSRLSLDLPINTEFFFLFFLILV